MSLQKSLLPFILTERLLKTNLQEGKGTEASQVFKVLNDELFYRNHEQVRTLRASCRTITNYVVTKRVR